MEQTVNTEFNIKDFLKAALTPKFPDVADEKSKTLETYAQMLTDNGLSSESTIDYLMQAQLEKLGVKTGHAIAISQFQRKHLFLFTDNISC
jgi:hypothetical protein